MAVIYRPSLDEARELAQQSTLIPIYRELPADLETPVSVYRKLCSQGGGPSFLLESVEKGEQLGRYSFIGVHAPMTITARGDRVLHGAAGNTLLEERQGDPLQILEEFMAPRKSAPVPGLPRFNGGI
ncbi:MAG: anthranilate synthase component I, partial [Caldilinea sp.]